MLTVMTFNIRYGTAEDGPNHWRHRRDLAVARIRAADPDLLGLQECRADDQADTVRAALPDYAFYGVPRGGGDDSALEMAPVLWRASAFDRLEQGVFWLSETPQIPASKSWNSTFARVVTWVALRHRASDRTLLFASTHFDLTPTAIDGAARVLRHWADDQAAQPLIIVGDFNAGKDSFAWGHLTAGGRLSDAYRHVWPDGGADEATFHGYGRPGGHYPIDWILASPHFASTAAAVDRHQAGGVFPSDHYPLTASLTWA